jgi:DNA-binding SARP family transcriptional activator
MPAASDPTPALSDSPAIRREHVPAAETSVDTADAAAAGRLHVCGEPAFVHPDGRRTPIEAKDALLLAYLAIEGPTPRARLATFLWPEVDRERARASLRQRLFRLRRLLGFEPLQPGETTELAAGLATDLAPADPEAEASLAPLLGSFEWRGSGEAGAWLARARARHAEQRLDALRAAAQEHEVQSRLANAIGLAQRLINADPLSEHAHRRLMRLHYLRGDRAAAIAAFEFCERVLKDELGTAPGSETLALLKTVEAAGPAPASPRRPFVPVSVLRPPRLIGRDRELGELSKAWQNDRSFCILGEAGMGKSRLLAEFAASLPGLVSVQARPGDAAIPYALMARTLRAVRAHASTALVAPNDHSLVAVLPELAAPDPTAAVPNRPGLQHAVEQLLARARSADLGGILIDDLHFADEPSVNMLSTLVGARSLNGLGLGMARRPAETPAAAQALSDAGTETRCMEEVRLAPLDGSQLAELVESLGVPGLDAAALAPSLLRHTGGNPLFVLETLKVLILEGAEGQGSSGKLPVPSSIGGLIEQRLKRLSAEALALARVAAVAGVDFGSALAEHVLQVRAVDLASPWGELLSAQIFKDDAFAHDLVFDAVLGTIPKPVAQRIHGAVAAFLEQNRGEPARIAGHWLRADQGTAAVPWLQRAAERALAAFERPAAVGFLEQASAIEAVAGRMGIAFRLQADAIDLLQGYDSGSRHDLATSRVLELATTPAQRAEAQCLRAVFLHIVGRPAESLAAVERGEHEAAAADDERVVPRLLNVRGIVLRRMGQAAGARQAHERGVAIERRLGLTANLAASLNNLALALMELDEHAQAISRFEESAQLQTDLATRARVLNNMAISQEETGGSLRALKTRENALALLAGQEGVAAIALNITHSIGANARKLLRFVEAQRWFDQADAMAREVHHWRAEDLQLQRALMLIELGDWSAADDLLSRVEAAAQPLPALRLDRLQARARYLLRRGLDASVVLSQAVSILPAIDERRTVRRVLALQLATLGPEAALALAQREISIEAARGNEATQVAFLVAAARALLQLDRAAEAHEFSSRAVAMLDRVWPVEFSPFEARLAHLETMGASDRPGRREAAECVAKSLLHLAAEHVPQAHHGGFLRGHPVHRKILRLAGMERWAGSG